MPNQNPPDPATLLDQVHDPESFLRFAQALLEDRRVDIQQERKTPSSPYSRTARGWENTTLEHFLDSAIAWFQDSKFGALDTSAPNPWRLFANFLLAGKMYE